MACIDLLRSDILFYFFFKKIKKISFFNNTQDVMHRRGSCERPLSYP